MKVTVSELEQLKPLVIPVIGPTNEGKTSVLRTLTGDADFGEINALTGTTKRAIIQKVFYKGVEILQLIDTPGFQMSGSIRDLLENTFGDKEIVSPEEIIQVIPPRDPDFVHDLRAWQAVQSGDIVIFVANVMESPEQSLVQDTLSLLTDSRKPIIVIFNNIHDNKTGQNQLGCLNKNYQEEWIRHLLKNRIYLWQVYDAHNRSFKNEMDLFEKILVHVQDTLMQKVLRQELQERTWRELRRLSESRQIIVNLIMDAARYRQTAKDVSQDEKAVKTKELVNSLNEGLYVLEHKAHLEILKAWDFRAGILERATLAIEHSEQERKDLFSEDAWKNYTKGVTWGAGIGAGVGLCLDVALAGLSLGTGTAIGTFIGGAIGTGVKGFHHFQYDKYQRIITVRPQKDLLILLLTRAIELVQKLQARGKALEDGVQVVVSKTPEFIKDKTILNLLDSIMKECSKSGLLTKSKRLLGSESINEEKLATLLLQALENILEVPER